ncbi:MAG TPA: HEAT repeat domain-containing protein [Bacteroidota bacterium]
MDHEQYKEWIQLLVYDELKSDEQASLDQHMAGCTECRAELQELRNLKALLSKAPGFHVSDSLLEEARQELRAALRIERSRISLWDRITGRLDDLFSPLGKVALSGVAMLTVGFLAGYLVFSSAPAGNALQAVSDDTEVERGEARITNVRFDDSDPADGEIEFTFEAVSPVRIKGNPNDAAVQSVLMKALMTEENPGVRLRTVSAITSQIQIGGNVPSDADNDVKRALVDAMKFDPNPGVRKEAMQALKRFPFDDAIKDGLLYVLSHDKSEGLRVEAINSLGTARDQIKASDEKLLETLQRRMETDNNRYVRQQARAVLQEVRQQ